MIDTSSVTSVGTMFQGVNVKMSITEVRQIKLTRILAEVFLFVWFVAFFLTMIYNL